MKCDSKKTGVFPSSRPRGKIATRVTSCVQASWLRHTALASSPRQQHIVYPFLFLHVLGRVGLSFSLLSFTPETFRPGLDSNSTFRHLHRRQGLWSPSLHIGLHGSVGQPGLPRYL